MKKKDNPFVTIETCNERYNNINSKIIEILNILKGKNHEDLGLLGDIRDIKRDRKWIYSIIMCLGIPLLILLIKFMFGL